MAVIRKPVPNETQSMYAIELAEGRRQELSHFASRGLRNVAGVRLFARPLEETAVIDPQLADLVADHAGRDAQLPGGLGTLPARRLQGVGDHVLLLRSTRS